MMNTKIIICVGYGVEKNIFQNFKILNVLFKNIFRFNIYCCILFSTKP